MFFKVVHNTTTQIIVDVYNTNKEMTIFVRWNIETKKFDVVNYSDANGLLSKDRNEVYNIDNFDDEFVGYEKPYKKCYLEEITEDEYNTLKELIKTDIVNDEGIIISKKDILDNKIVELSQECERIIKNGADIVLSDDESHHFSFEMSDQIKISKLYDKAKSGETFLPYHADNELEKIFTAEDITKLNTAMEQTVDYQTAYFNSLKMYLKSVVENNVSVVYDANYGMEIPEEHKSDVLKYLEQELNSDEE